MRPSSIAQGLKSWASKLHPQLPLTNQESSRLLNALTSAFREKLDEAHPRNPSDNNPNTQGTSNSVARSAGAFHSSAAHADKHLQSVLTNPLLGGRVLDYGTAKVELTKHPNKDPVELLEEYQAKGAASMAIAELCLDRVRKSIERLPQVQRKAAIEKADAGRRVLKWLLENNLDDPKSYADRISLLGNLVFFLVNEGREGDVWMWVKLDIKSNDVPQTEGSRLHVHRKTTLFQYRWRGRILRALIQAKFAPVDKNKEDQNAAFDTLFEIHKLKLYAGWSDHQLPMRPISTFFGKMFAMSHVVSSDSDVVRFDKYIALMPFLQAHAPSFLVDFERAKLLLKHPHGRQPAAAARCFRQLFSENHSEGVRPFINGIRTTGNQSMIHSWWTLLTTTIYALRQEGNIEDADWLRARCAEEFPQKESHFEARMNECRRYDMDRGARLGHRATDVKDHTRIPFPTFA